MTDRRTTDVNLQAIDSIEFMHRCRPRVVSGDTGCFFGQFGIASKLFTQSVDSEVTVDVVDRTRRGRLGGERDVSPKNASNDFRNGVEHRLTTRRCQAQQSPSCSGCSVLRSASAANSACFHSHRASCINTFFSLKAEQQREQEKD